MAHGLAPAGLRALQNSDGALTGVLTTYGVVTFDDDGTPLWICEEATGEEGLPRAAVRTDDGALVVVGPREGLFISYDEGCSYASVAALADVIVTDVVRDKSGRVLVATRDPRTDGLLAVVDVDAHSLTTLATFPNAIVDGFASDGVRVAVALTRVGDGTTSMLLVDEGDLTPIAGVVTAAIPFVDENGDIVIAREDVAAAPNVTDGVPGWTLTSLDESGALESAPHTALRRRPRGYVLYDRVRYVISDDGLLTDGPNGTASVSGVTNPTCIVVAASEVIVCAQGRSRELVGASFGDRIDRFDTASVRPRACADGTRGASVCPAIWDYLQSTQAIGRERPSEDDDDESGCAACRVGASAPLSMAAMALVVVFSARRRRLRRL